MEGLLRWLQELPLSIWISESQSIWGFATILVLHTLGIAMSAGAAAVIALRFLGAASSIPLDSLGRLVPVFWIGFVLNSMSGTLLFIAAAATTGYHPLYYVKLACVFAGTVAFHRLQHLITPTSPPSVPVSAKATTLAASNLVLWTCAITAGRFIAYTA